MQARRSALSTITNQSTGVLGSNAGAQRRMGKTPRKTARTDVFRGEEKGTEGMEWGQRSLDELLESCMNWKLMTVSRLHTDLEGLSIA